MARLVTLTSLLAQVRQRADLDSAVVTDSFIGDPELTEYINASLAELYDLLVGAYGDEYYLSQSAIPVVADKFAYDLPADFYKADGVVMIVNGYSSRLEHFQQPDLAYWYNQAKGEPQVWAVKATALTLLPTPSGPFNVTLLYIPAPPRLVNPGDTFDGVAGWEEYAVVDAALKCKEKEDLTSPALERRKGALKQRIEEMAQNRNASSPATVVDNGYQWDV